MFFALAHGSLRRHGSTVGAAAVFGAKLHSGGVSDDLGTGLSWSVRFVWDFGDDHLSSLVSAPQRWVD